MNKLAQWMEQAEITDDKLAELVAIDRSTASRLRRGKLGASIPLIRRLVAVSDGQLSADDLLSLNEAA